MRLDIYGQFFVDVVTPRDGWSKGRPIAVIEDGNSSYPADLLIPNGLTESELEHYVANRYTAFAEPGKEISRVDRARRTA